MNDLKYWIWLLKTNLSQVTLRKLLKKYGVPKNIYTAKEPDLKNLCLKDEEINILKNRKCTDNLDLYIKYMNKNNIELITIFDKEYPEKLKYIYDAPVALFIKGDKTILNDKALAIVGARDCSQYGKAVAQKIAYQVSKNNINIISGLAKGIDAIAHEGAIKANGKTIAVLRFWTRLYISKRKQGLI